MSRASLLKWANVCAFLLMIAVNAAANLVPIGGNTTGEVSAAYPTLFAPAAGTFAIWGVIYVLMAVFVLFQLFPQFSDARGATLRDKVGPLFVVGCLANIGWIFAWHFRLIALSMVFMVALLVSLVIVNARLSLGETGALIGKVSVFGFQVYLGWIVAATIANASVLLVQLEWDGFGVSPEIWTIVVLIAGLIVGVLLTLVGNAPFATMGVAWAYVGILARYLMGNGSATTYPLIIVTLIASLLVMLSVAILRLAGDFEGLRFRGGMPRRGLAG